MWQQIEANKALWTGRLKVLPSPKNKGWRAALRWDRLRWRGSHSIRASEALNVGVG